MRTGSLRQFRLGTITVDIDFLRLILDQVRADSHTIVTSRSRSDCTLGHRHLKQIRNQLLRWVKRWVILLLQLSRPDLLTNLAIVHLLNWLVFYNAEGMILIATRCQKLLLLACARLDSCVGVVTNAWLWIAIWCLEIAYASHVLLLKTVRVLHLPWLGIPGMLSGLDGTIASKFLIEHN